MCSRSAARAFTARALGASVMELELDIAAALVAEAAESLARADPPAAMALMPSEEPLLTLSAAHQLWWSATEEEECHRVLRANKVGHCCQSCLDIHVNASDLLWTMYMLMTQVIEQGSGLHTEQNTQASFTRGLCVHYHNAGRPTCVVASSCSLDGLMYSGVVALVGDSSRASKQALHAKVLLHILQSLLVALCCSIALLGCQRLHHHLTSMHHGCQQMGIPVSWFISAVSSCSYKFACSC